MLSFKFEIDSYDDEVSGYDMGHLTLNVGEQVLVSSKSEGSKHLMMLFLSLPDLLDGVRRLLNGLTPSYEFVGVDSSFVLNISRVTNKLVRFSHKNCELLQIRDSELATGLILIQVAP